MAKSKHSVNGWFHYTNYLECDLDQVFHIEQSIPAMGWPFGIDQDYINLVKPQGFLRYWYKLDNPANVVELNVFITFDNGATEFGKQETLEGAEPTEKKMVETNILLPDLSSLTIADVKYVSYEHE